MLEEELFKTSKSFIMEQIYQTPPSGGMIRLITGFDAGELSKQQLSYVKALVVASLSCSILFAFTIAWNINFHIRFLTVSAIIGLILLCILLIANRTLFILSNGAKKWFVVAVIVYLLVYLIISIIAAGVIQYYFLVQNIDQTVISSGLDEMAAIEMLKEHLSQSQLQTLRKLTGTFSVISFVFATIPLIFLFTFRKQQSPFEREVSIQRQGIERRLIEAKKELAELYSTPSSNKDEIHDPFFSVEESVTPNSEERMRKAITLQDEITHLTHILNTQFP